MFHHSSEHHSPEVSSIGQHCAADNRDAAREKAIRHSRHEHHGNSAEARQQQRRAADQRSPPNSPPVRSTRRKRRRSRSLSSSPSPSRSNHGQSQKRIGQAHARGGTPRRLRAQAAECSSDGGAPSPSRKTADDLWATRKSNRSPAPSPSCSPPRRSHSCGGHRKARRKPGSSADVSPSCSPSRRNRSHTPRAGRRRSGSNGGSAAADEEWQFDHVAQQRLEAVPRRGRGGVGSRVFDTGALPHTSV